MTEENKDIFEIDVDYHIFPYDWECPYCKKVYKLRSTDDFKCECGCLLEFKFIKYKKEYV